MGDLTGILRQRVAQLLTEAHRRGHQTALACHCHDPLVFGHHPTCPLAPRKQKAMTEPIVVQAAPEKPNCPATAGVTCDDEVYSLLTCALPEGHDLPHWDDLDNVYWAGGSPA